MEKNWVNWNDATYVWKGSEDFLWNEAYRIVNDVKSAGLDWTDKREWERVKRKISPESAEKFLDIVIKVNGLTHKYKKNVQEKPKITIEHVQKTFKHFEHSGKISVKAEIIKS